MIKRCEEMRCVGKKTSNSPFQRGLVISSKSLLGLYDVLKQRYNIDYIMTAHLNQDCIENLFSRIRAVGGSYSHPTSVEFIHRLKKLIVGRSSELVIKTTSVQIEDDLSKTENFSFLSQKLTKGVENQTPTN